MGPETNKDSAAETDLRRGFRHCTWRYALIGFGGLNVAVGAVGLVVPGLPTTVFMLIALWAFSKSSTRFHIWLYTHPRLGPPLQAWHQHRVISRKAKCLALCTMAASLVILSLTATGWVLPAATGAVMAVVALFLVSRPSAPPAYCSIKLGR